MSPPTTSENKPVTTTIDNRPSEAYTARVRTQCRDAEPPGGAGASGRGDGVHPSPMERVPRGSGGRYRDRLGARRDRGGPTVLVDLPGDLPGDRPGGHRTGRIP